MQNKIYSFIDCVIEDMFKTVEFSKQVYAGKEWAISEINDEYERGFGALLFSKCYEHSITELEYDALMDRLYDSREEALKQLGE